MVIASDQPVLVRHVVGLRGRMRFKCEFAMRFDYGLVVPRLEQTGDGLIAIAGPDMVALRGPLPLAPTGDQVFAAEFDVAPGQSCAFSLAYGLSHGAPPAEPDLDQALDHTLTFWRQWAARFQRRYSVARRSYAVAPNPQSADLSPYRRDGGRTDRLLAGKPRSRPQLGLSLLLAAGCNVHALGAVERRFS